MKPYPTILAVGLRPWLTTTSAALLLSACDGEQSTFTGAGPSALVIARLTSLLLIGGGVIALFICSLIAIALFGPGRWRQTLARESNIVVGGIVFPVLVLTSLLFYGFALLRSGGQVPGAGNAVTIQVIGEQWWWRIQYLHADGSVTDSANELRIPTGRAIELRLLSADVIHSFWVPAYAGKVDMIPGRTNYLRFSVDEPGIARGQCAEYCGGAHALMAFYALAMAPADYEQWLAEERQPAINSRDRSGETLFLASGCGACHTVRGTAADGVIGPDLTHVGRRLSLGAGILANDQPSFTQWIDQHQQLKPGNGMPPYDFLTAAELTALGHYLESLE